MAEPLRIATWHAPLSRDGPGLLIQDVQRGKADDVTQQIADLRADVLLLTDIDFDLDLFALTLLRDRVDALGWRYDHLFALPPNTGMPTGFDLDRNGRLNEPRDAQGYGRYQGQAGMALLSRHPIDHGAVRDLSAQLWADMPDSLFPQDYFSEDEANVLRLSHAGHWIVPVSVRGQALTLMAYAAATPVFDGPEDRNGRRNADETRLWLRLLDQEAFGAFVILGKPNLDPVDGEGRREAIHALLNDPRVQDPMPRGPGGVEAANPEHRGDPALDTADYEDPEPGNLRVSYVLPWAGAKVLGSGIEWPVGLEPSEQTRHFPVWIDLDF